jgi:hypothetical protein
MEDPAIRTAAMARDPAHGLPKRQDSWASGFDAFGKPVPIERQVAALDCAVEVMGVDAVLADPIIAQAAQRIAADEPLYALTVLMNIVDLTGAYRLIAVMCCDG